LTLLDSYVNSFTNYLYSRRINGGVIMWRDPIVQDVRKAGEQLAKQANYNLHTFFQNLRINEKKRGYKIVTRIDDKAISTKVCGT